VEHSRQLSIIIPFYNEAENVDAFLQILSSISLPVEYILVDDGSTDQTLEILKKHIADHTKIISLSKNSGQSTAIKAGIDYSKGNYIAILDGDLQNNPNDINQLLQLVLNNTADVAQGVRVNRQDNITKTFPSAIANSFIRLVFGVKLHDVGCSLKVFKREVSENIIYFNGFHRYFSLLAHINGFKIVELPVAHSKRYAGKSKYGLSRTFTVVKHLLLLKFQPKFLNTKLPYHVKAIF